MAQNVSLLARKCRVRNRQQTDHGHDAQKFKLKAVEGGGYQLLAKCSNDEKCVMVSAGSAPNDVFAIRANIELGTAGSDSEPRSIWYFEPADEGDCVAYNKSTRYRRQNSPVSEREFLKIGKGHVEAK